SILKQYWGYDAFRGQQEQIIKTVLEGKNVLGLLPTGAGKSLCYQVPALAKGGCCLVVSPLVALMKDQVERLKSIGIKAEALFSGMPYWMMDRILDNAIYGDTQFLYVSPERIQTELMQHRLNKLPLSLIAIDEAHCVSQWGFDFRPAYLQLESVQEMHPSVPVIALTATATPKVEEDIIVQLNLKNPTKFKQSFIRSNIAYRIWKRNDKKTALLELVKKYNGSGIVYARSRRACEELSAWLKDNNCNASFYHAGLHREERDRRQSDWQNNVTQTMVCTNAFGMGIDKPDVQLVAHWHLPDSMEAYYQEAGRVGRDGNQAFAYLLYNKRD
ncbi:UNVERIFIED_CONTAM: hypothetical protein GTU68_015423, partial [Idotea baltica]|nr:hypothetical protein [Idotea baltica]